MTKVLIDLLLKEFLDDFDEVAQILRIFNSTELKSDLIIEIYEHEHRIQFQDDIVFVNRLLEFNQLFDGDGLPNLNFNELKQVYEANPDYPKQSNSTPK